jgi:hypothetical protein
MANSCTSMDGPIDFNLINRYNAQQASPQNTSTYFQINLEDIFGKARSSNTVRSNTTRLTYSVTEKYQILELLYNEFFVTKGERKILKPAYAHIEQEVTNAFISKLRAKMTNKHINMHKYNYGQAPFQVGWTLDFMLYNGAFNFSKANSQTQHQTFQHVFFPFLEEILTNHNGVLNIGYCTFFPFNVLPCYQLYFSDFFKSQQIGGKKNKAIKKTGKTVAKRSPVKKSPAKKTIKKNLRGGDKLAEGNFGAVWTITGMKDFEDLYLMKFPIQNENSSKDAATRSGLQSGISTGVYRLNNSEQEYGIDYNNKFLKDNVFKVFKSETFYDSEREILNNVYNLHMNNNKESLLDSIMTIDNQGKLIDTVTFLFGSWEVKTIPYKRCDGNLMSIKNVDYTTLLRAIKAIVMFLKAIGPKNYHFDIKPENILYTVTKTSYGRGRSYNEYTFFVGDYGSVGEEPIATSGLYVTPMGQPNYQEALMEVQQTCKTYLANMKESYAKTTLSSFVDNMSFSEIAYHYDNDPEPNFTEASETNWSFAKEDMYAIGVTLLFLLCNGFVNPDQLQENVLEQITSIITKLLNLPEGINTVQQLSVIMDTIIQRPTPPMNSS